MGYYAIVAPAYIGHLNPMTVLGRELQRRGHRIAVAAPCDARARVRRAGLEFLPVASVEFPEGAWELTTARMGELSGLKASRFVGHWLGRFTQGILRDLPEMAAREKFDGLVMDQISLGAESVCAVLGLPLAVACNALILHAEPGVPPAIFHWRCRNSLPFRVRNLFGLLVGYSTGWPVTWQLARFGIAHRLPRIAFNHMNEMPPSLVQVAQQPACQRPGESHRSDRNRLQDPPAGGRLSTDSMNPPFGVKSLEYQCRTASVAWPQCRQAEFSQCRDLARVCAVRIGHPNLELPGATRAPLRRMVAATPSS